jgi:hypothetical protein
MRIPSFGLPWLVLILSSTLILAAYKGGAMSRAPPLGEAMHHRRAYHSIAIAPANLPNEPKFFRSCAV